MSQLNYNHLHYFWVVASVGSIARAAEALHVTPQTISGQLRTLETRLGATLFQKIGRKLELTETGKIVRSYAEPIFALGLELGDVLKKRLPSRFSPLAVGVATCVPKLITHRVVAPALHLSPRTRVVCHQAPTEALVADLLARRIDLAVTDSPIASTSTVRVQSHLVGTCGVTIFGTRELVERYLPSFPRSLHGAPFVLPARTSGMRDALIAWFRRERVAPSIVAEIESPDLVNALCETAAALFALPTIARDTEQTCRVARVGDAPIEQQFYAASVLRDGDELVATIVDYARKAFERERPRRVPRAISVSSYALTATSHE